MTAVLVHGVPETARLWDTVRRHLRRADVVAVELPGFGIPRPAGFGSTMDEYADWLIEHLEQVVDDGGGQPVDLVGHDWGGGFTVRLVSRRPDLVRTWVTDAAGLADPEFVWHDVARLWQTPGEGEAFFEQQQAIPIPERAAFLSTLGIPEDDARVMAAALDAEMAASILALYRSATEVHERWGPDFVDIPKPGLVVIPTEDPFLDGEGARRAAARAGARVEVVDGLGHWWMLQDPARAAALLEGFWASA